MVGCCGSVGTPIEIRQDIEVILDSRPPTPDHSRPRWNPGPVSSPTPIGTRNLSFRARVQEQNIPRIPIGNEIVGFDIHLVVVVCKKPLRLPMRVDNRVVSRRAENELPQNPSSILLSVVFITGSIGWDA